MAAGGGPPAWLLRLCCPAEGRRAFTLLYAYFRVLDDQVDAPGAQQAPTLALLRAQEGLRRGERPPEAPFELALAEVQASALGPRLGPAIEGMARALAFDADRRGEARAQAELEAQVARIGDAYLLAVWVCSGASGAPPPALHPLARAATATHQLRDLELDLGLGYVNVPAEVLAGRGPDGLLRAELRPWLQAQGEAIDRHFREGARALPLAPLRTRLLLWALTWRYRRLLRAQRT